MSRPERWFFGFSPLLLVGCWNPFSPPQEPGTGYPLPLTDSIVFQNMQAAYVSLDLEGYMSCLDDSFKFYFDPGEEGILELLKNNWGLDSLVWGRTEERLSAQTLFDYIRESEGGNLDLTLSQLRRIRGDDTSSVWICDYYLVIEPPPDEGSSVAEGRARFSMKKHRDTGLWYIIRWEDFGGS